MKSPPVVFLKQDTQLVHFAIEYMNEEKDVVLEICLKNRQEMSAFINSNNILLLVTCLLIFDWHANSCCFITPLSPNITHKYLWQFTTSYTFSLAVRKEPVSCR